MTDKEFVTEKLAAHSRELANIVEQFLGPEARYKFLLAADNKELMAARNILEDAWIAAPDKPWIHEIPHWLTLCDICASPDLD